MLRHLTPDTRQLLFFLAAASAAILGGALIGQYGFGLYPCELCLYQRWPHAAVIAFGLIGALAPLSGKARRHVLYLCLGALVIGALIAGYHAGVEADIFKGPEACSAAPGTDKTLEELRNEIAGAALVSCKQAMGYILGLSLAAWNLIISACLIIVILLLLQKRTPQATDN